MYGTHIYLLMYKSFLCTKSLHSGNVQYYRRTKNTETTNSKAEYVYLAHGKYSINISWRKWEGGGEGTGTKKA